MNWSPNRRLRVSYVLPVVLLAGSLHRANAQQGSAPVPYASVSELNVLLAQVEQASQASQLDLAKLRVEKWKVDSSSKQQAQANVDSLSRNMHNALPEIIGQLRSSPEDLSATFKLYRNLDALYDVFGSVVESAGAFGSKDDFQALENDLSAMERARRSIAERMESLSASKEAELDRLRTQVKNSQASATVPTAPKKVVIDDTQPAKKTVKPAKKKPVPTPANPPAPQ
jgi:stress response protein YsnF